MTLNAGSSCGNIRLTLCEILVNLVWSVDKLSNMFPQRTVLFSLVMDHRSRQRFTTARDTDWKAVRGTVKITSSPTAWKACGIQRKPAADRWACRFPSRPVAPQHRLAWLRSGRMAVHQSCHRHLRLTHRLRRIKAIRRLGTA